SRVQLLIDHNAAAGALVERTRVGGLVVGTGGRGPLEMDKVSSLADVKVGDRVVSSGIDGIYPKGYAIGWIETVAGRGLYFDLTVRPAVDFNSLEEVLVVLVPPRPALEDDGKPPPPETRK
ncbi:MAG: rod shape-determining protein MreC, partial [Vicinamibacterales bacterium]